MSASQTERQPLLRPLINPQDVEATSVYPLIHRIRADVMHFIDTPLTYEALTAPDLTYTLVHPLVEKYAAVQREGNKSVVFCFLLNRVRFLRDHGLASRTLSRSRAEFCEIIAIRTLREYGNSVLDLTIVLTTSWSVFSGVDPELFRRAEDDRGELDDKVGNGIEMAILGKAKNFIKASSCQRVIDAIWTGRCIYQADSSHSILSDTYKRTPVHFYDPHKAPLLDHYRLKVPAIRAVLEYSNFVILFILFVIAIEVNERDHLNTPEIAFMIYALGFTLEKLATMQEHGIRVYFTGTWNGFDLAFIAVYLPYAILRIYGIYNDSLWARSTGTVWLAIIACLMFPRLAFVTLKNNLMVLSLRAMMTQFAILMLIAAFCFCGFLYALWTLSRNGAGYSAGTIAWWMLDLWFGLDASGFDRAARFDPVFGPILMVTYACLSNTLLLTVLVSILSHTFSTINEDAVAEAMFRKAVSTIEGVKADPIFSYQPPVNLFALLIMLPASHFLSPRWFHKLNVFMIRATSFPILLLIAWYERQSKKTGSSSFYETMSSIAEKLVDTLPRSIKRMTFIESWGGHGIDIDAIFELEEGYEESALDTHDAEDSLPAAEASIGVHVPSAADNKPGHSPPRTGSPNKRSSFPSSAAKPVPRLRVNSIIGRSVEGPSPLAQIFQPLVVQEDEPTNVGISYGPVNRRQRLSMQSVHKRSQTDTHGVQPFSATTPKKSPVADRGRSPRSLFHQSLDDISRRREPSEEPETAQQLVEDEDETTLSGRWFARLGDIEERQKRMEDMLVQITNELKTR